MASYTTSKVLGLTLGAALSVAWIGSVLFGMQTASAPEPAVAPRTIELPTVVVVGHKSAAVNATALSATPVARKA